MTLTPVQSEPDRRLTNHPLSLPQEQLWLVQDLRPDTTEYNEIWPLRIRGRLDAARLEQAVNTVITRHEALRSSFPVLDGTPVCRIRPEVRLALGTPLDLTQVPEPHRGPVAERLARNLAERPFDLHRGPLVRGSLLRLSGEEHVLLIGTHHIVADGWSLRVFMDEIAHHYDHPEALLPPVPRYTDFVRSQRSLLTGEEMTAHAEYWRERLAGAPDVLNVHPGDLRPPVKSTKGVRTAIDLDPALSRRVRRRASEVGATAAGLLLAAFGVVLSRYADSADLIIGTGGEGRPSEQYESVIGFFANTLPLRLHIDQWCSFAELGRNATDVGLDALDHQDLPFPALVEMVGATRDLSFGPLVQVVFKTADFSDAYQEVGPLRVRYEQIGRSRSRFDLIVEAQLEPDLLRLWVEYDAKLFDEVWVQRMARHVENVLAAGLRDPATPVADLPMLTAEERDGWLPEPGPRGTPVPARPVVLGDGGQIAPTGVIGHVHQIDPAAVRVVGDRIEPLDGALGPQPTRYSGRMTPERGVEVLGSTERYPRINGLVVPLDRVQAVLSVHPAVRSASVRSHRTAGGAVRLTAEVTPTDPGFDSWDELRQFAAARLPRYAVPQLSDRTVSAAPAGVERVVRDAWCAVLGCADVGADDEFFASGGHSMAATRLAAAIRETLGVVFPVRQVFENPGFTDLVRAVAAAPLHGGSTDPAGTAGAEPPGVAPLTGSQEQIWVMEQLAPGQPVCHSPVLVDIDGALHVAALREAFDLVVSRHEALRVGYMFESAQPVQRLLTDAPSLSVVHLSGLPARDAEAEAERIATREALRPFALDREAGIRATLLIHSAQRSQLMLTIHHIAMDGVGFGVLLEELGAAYRALQASARPALPAPRRGWLDYARAERRALARREPELVEFWRNHLSGARELELPWDAGTELTFGGDHRAVLLTEQATAAFQATARRAQVTGFVLATAALTAALHDMTGALDIPVGAAMENRTVSGSERLVGCTTNLAVLRLDCTGDPSFGQFLARVRDATLAAQEHQELPFPKIVKAAGCPRTSGRLPLVGVTTEWHDLRHMHLDLAGCRTSWRYLRTGTARNDLVFTASMRPEGIDLSVEFNTATWSVGRVDALLGRVCGALAAGPETPLSRLTEVTAS